jgi:hypothetical protein
MAAQLEAEPPTEAEGFKEIWYAEWNLRWRS